MLGQARWQTVACLLLCVSAAAWADDPGTDAEAETTTAPNTLSGSVLGSGDEPVHAATVWVGRFAQTPRKKHRYEEWFEPVATTTDEQGRFSIRLEFDGPYRLYVVHPEHPSFHESEQIDAGEPTVVTLPAPIESHGFALDREGEPFANADVIACGPGATTLGEHACLRTRSGDDGKFTFDRLSPGAHRFQAWAPGQRLSGIETVELPLEPKSETAEALTLTLQPGAEISGTLVDDAGTALSGVHVYYSTDRVRLRQARGSRDTEHLSPILTGPDGSFALHGLPPDEPLKLFAWADDLSPVESETFSLKPGSVRTGLTLVHLRPAMATIRVVDGDERPVDGLDLLWRAARRGESGDSSAFRMAGAEGKASVEVTEDGTFSITGIKPDRYDLTVLPTGYEEIVLEDVDFPPAGVLDLGTHVARPGIALEGYVVDDLGRSIAGAKIEGMYLKANEAMARSVRSDKDGRFRLGGLGEEPLLWLLTTADGHAPARERSVLPDQTGYEITLDRVGRVAGRALLEDGDSPIELEAALEDTAGGLIAFRRESQRSAQGDEEGRFEILDAGPGTYSLRLSAAGTRPLRVKDVVVVAGESTDVGTHRLDPGQQVSGVVVDSRNDRPVVNAAIRIDSAGGAMFESRPALDTTVTDADGRFLINGLIPGRLILKAEHPDYAPATEPITLTADEPAGQVMIRLGQGGTLRGVVRDQDGRPSAARSIGIIEGGGFDPGDNFVRTNDAGEYLAERLSPGSYRVVLYPDTALNSVDLQQKNASIRAGEETIVDFDGGARITFEGLLTRGGHAVGNVTVVLVPVDDGDMFQTRSANVDLSGRFEVGLDRPGTYNVIVQENLRSRVGQAQIVVPDEPDVSLEIKLQSGAITGNVTDDAGQSVANSIVSAVREGASVNAPGPGAMVGPDGNYRLEGIEEGIYTVSIMADGYRVATRTVTLSGDSLDGIDFQLERAGELRGRVVDEHGNGISGAFVFSSAGGSAEGVGSMPTQSDADGFFNVSAPSEGPCDIEAVARGYAPGKLPGYVPDPGADGPGALVTLTVGARMVILVVDAAGRPIEGAQPVVQPEPPNQALGIALMLSPIRPTDGTGTSTVANLPAGSFNLSLSGRPEAGSQTISVGAAGETQVTLQLP